METPIHDSLMKDLENLIIKHNLVIEDKIPSMYIPNILNCDVGTHYYSLMTKDLIQIYLHNKHFIPEALKLFKKIIKKYTNEYPIDIIINKKIKPRINVKEHENDATVLIAALERFGWFDEAHQCYLEVMPSLDAIEDNLIIQENEMEHFTFRPNQIEAFDALNEHFETGIHCQATGCGKSYIIIRYIYYCMENFSNTNIILFTERVSILKDLFGFKKNVNQVSQDKIKDWKRLGIGDLTNLNVINCVTKKDRRWYRFLNNKTANNTKTLIVINRAFLTGSEYARINTLHAILHDECHNTSSKKCFEFLEHFHAQNVKIIGFSATPVRTGKNDLKKVTQIYGKNDDLHLITNYNLIHAIIQSLVVPPEFHWYHIESMPKKEITDIELGTVMDILNKIVPTLVHKKIIAWCGTIAKTKKWMELFQKNKRQRHSLATMATYMDTSQCGTGYDKFYKADGNAIMFCAAKHREGSDIQYLDCCIFLDGVENRGAIPFIQSVGRVLRQDRVRQANNNVLVDMPSRKTRGVIIEGIYRPDGYEKVFVDKIIGYYMSLANASSRECSQYEQYVQLSNMVEFNKDKEVIMVKINSKLTISINLNTIHWDNIVEKFDSILQHRVRLSTEDNMRHKAMILKNIYGFNINTDFLPAYQAIHPEEKKMYNLPDISMQNYEAMFVNKTWYEFLNVEHDFYPTMKDARTAIMALSSSNVCSPRQNWSAWCDNDARLPRHPQYWWNQFYYEYFTNDSHELEGLAM